MANEEVIKPINSQDVHRICSGQVIVSLAIAVKELVENSIDAGATRVDVRLCDYGVQSISVWDNGKGVHSRNYEALTKKHATSKLHSFEDLSEVGTFGFRGEALSSLCAMGELSVETKCEEDESENDGVLLEFDYEGKVVKKTPCARERGTTVTLKNLFATLPVRLREFKKNVKKEFAKMVTLIQAYCLISINLRLSCSNQIGKGGSKSGKKTIVVSCNSNKTIKDNIINVFGVKQFQQLMPIVEPSVMNEANEALGFDVLTTLNMKLDGYISKPEKSCGRSSGDRQYFYINGRPCDIPRLTKVVNETYRMFNGNQYPVFILNIVGRRDLYDVNVTPDKRSIFLQEEKKLKNYLKFVLEKMFQPSRSSYAVNDLTCSLPTFSRQKPKEEAAVKVDAPAETEENEDLHVSSVDNSFNNKEATHIREANDDSKDEANTYEDLHVSLVDNSFSNKEATHIREANDDSKDEANTVSLSNINVLGRGTTSKRGVTGSVEESSLESSKNPDENYQEQNFDVNYEQEVKKRPRTVSNSISNEDQDYQVEMVTYDGAKQPMKETIDAQDYQVEMIVDGELEGKDENGPTGEEEGTFHVEMITDDKVANSKNKSANLISSHTTSKENLTEPSEVRHENSELESNSATRELTVDEIIDMEYRQDVNKSYPRRNVSKRTETITIKRGRTHGESSGREGFSSSSRISSRRADSGGSSLNLSRKSKMVVVDSETEDESNDSEVSRPPAKKIQRKDRLAPTNVDHVMEDNAPPSLAVSEFKVSLDVDSVGQCVRRENGRIIHEHTDAASEKTHLFKAKISAETNEEAEEELRKTFMKEDFLKMEVVGQFNLGFIIARWKTDLFIVDQHASDEKYNYETLQQNTIVHSQNLIHPMPLELNVLSESILLDNLPIFQKNGFDFVVDGEKECGRQVSLSKIPYSKNVSFGKPDIEEMIHLLMDAPGELVRPSKVSAMFASRACRSSVMIGTALRLAKMKTILKHMSEIEQPWNCPHGRPTMRHLVDLKAISKQT
eukprot:Nk52_evm32s967 gene=Nk52_evmTU32s967